MYFETKKNINSLPNHYSTLLMSDNAIQYDYYMYPCPGATQSDTRYISNDNNDDDNNNNNKKK